jgi:hypothetical protein
MKQLLIALTCLALLIWGWNEYFREIPHLEQPGVLKNFELETRREFSGEFTVAGRQFYSPQQRAMLFRASAWVGEYNDLAYLSNVDVLLVQGMLADPQNLKKIDFKQHSRCYEFQLKPNAGFTAEQVRADSLNVNAIASNERITQKLRRLKPGQRVQLQGQYVNVQQLKTGKRFVTGMNIPLPRPQCSIIKITYIQVLS